VKVKGGLVGWGEGAVNCVHEHRFALGAVLRVAGLNGLLASELAVVLLVVCHLNHLPFYTL
jgi:hypothetical protein